MYLIRLGDNNIEVDGVLKIRNEPGTLVPYILIEKEKETIFFAPFDTISFVKKIN